MVSYKLIADIYEGLKRGETMKAIELKELNTIEIGSRIRARREILHITRRELAGRVSLSERSVAEIEYGSRGVSLKTLFRLKQILGVSADYILDGGECMLPDDERKKILNENIISSLSVCSVDQLICMEQIARLYVESIIFNG